MVKRFRCGHPRTVGNIVVRWVELRCAYAIECARCRRIRRKHGERRRKRPPSALRRTERRAWYWRNRERILCGQRKECAREHLAMLIYWQMRKMLKAEGYKARVCNRVGKVVALRDFRESRRQTQSERGKECAERMAVKRMVLAVVKARRFQRSNAD